MQLEKDAWYWVSHPHEGDIFIPILATGPNTIQINGENHHKDFVGDVTWNKAAMPDD